MSLPIRQDILVLPADVEDTTDRLAFQDQIIITSSGKTRRKLRHLNLGWTVEEVIGISYINSSAVSKLFIK